MEKAYTRARVLCQPVGESPQLFPVLWGLWAFYNARAEFQTAHELAEQCLHLAQRIQDPGLLLEAHCGTGVNFICGVESSPLARAHLEQGIALYDPRQHRSHAFLYGQDPGVFCLSFAARALYGLGYPDQALKRAEEALTLAQEVAHPHSLAYALVFAANPSTPPRRYKPPKVCRGALDALRLSRGFRSGWRMELSCGAGRWRSRVRERRGCADAPELGCLLGLQGRVCFGRIFLPGWPKRMGKKGELRRGSTRLAEALAVVDKTGERIYEAELYRLKGRADASPV